MHLDKVKVVHEVGSGNILAFLNPLQTFKTTFLLLGNGIEAVAGTSPLAEDLTDAAWLRLPWALCLACQNILNIGVL